MANSILTGTVTNKPCKDRWPWTVLKTIEIWLWSIDYGPWTIRATIKTHTYTNELILN